MFHSYYYVRFRIVQTKHTYGKSKIELSQLTATATLFTANYNLFLNKANRVTDQHSILTRWWIEVKTFIQDCSPLALVVSMVTITTILFFQAPNDINDYHLIFLTWKERIFSTVFYSSPIGIWSPYLYLKFFWGKVTCYSADIVAL